MKNTWNESYPYLNNLAVNYLRKSKRLAHVSSLLGGYSYVSHSVFHCLDPDIFSFIDILLDIVIVMVVVIVIMIVARRYRAICLVGLVEDEDIGPTISTMITIWDIDIRVYAIYNT